MNNIQTQLSAKTANVIRRHCHTLPSTNGIALFYCRLDEALRVVQEATRRIAKTGGLFFLLFLPLLCRGESILSLAPPLVAAKNAGEEYLPNLEKMEKHLKESNLLEFYLEAERFTKKINFTRKERGIGPQQLNGKEEHVACDWFSYYLAKSPLFSDEWVRDKLKYSVTDIQLKRFALECILVVNVERRAALLGVDKQKLRALYLNYAKIIFKSLNTTRIELEKLRKQDWDKFCEEEKTWKRSATLDDDEIRRRTLIERTSRGISFLRHERSDECRWVAELNQNGLLYMLLEEYPNSASRIHAFFFEIGYSKEQFVRQFRKKFGGNKKTEYLFNGLPKLKD
jgi:hypothetical protein